ncbi:DUF3165 family protein [Lactococcus nasutitermitis]|uniref:DUF3165 family protein n=1 Tax=Lactococcus nasutitermitis TaxID=1652957 RepID=A0ABV9JAH9_9LACT|nr:DUF3165 family protein [Lactococcus nasutitermitis]
MFYIILLILLALAYFFLMPRDIRRSMDIFFFAVVVVLLISVAVAQAVLNQGLILEILIVLAGIAVTVKAWFEIGNLDKHKRKNRRK